MCTTTTTTIQLLLLPYIYYNPNIHPALNMFTLPPYNYYYFQLLLLPPPPNIYPALSLCTTTNTTAPNMCTTTNTNTPIELLPPQYTPSTAACVKLLLPPYNYYSHRTTPNRHPALSMGTTTNTLSPYYYYPHYISSIYTQY